MTDEDSLHAQKFQCNHPINTTDLDLGFPWIWSNSKLIENYAYLVFISDSSSIIIIG